MYRLLIADDHAVVRAGYRLFFEQQCYIAAIGEAASGGAVLDMLREAAWDLLLLDIQMPDRSGLDILRHVKSGYPAVRTLVVSGLPEEQYARTVLRAGASGYVSKGVVVDELLNAVRTVLAGRRYVSASLAESMAADLDGNRDAPLHSRLSSREFQVFCKVASGMGVTAIGEELSLSVKTVSTYRARVLVKLGFKSSAEITAYALRHGIIQ